MLGDSQPSLFPNRLLAVTCWYWNQKLSAHSALSLTHKVLTEQIVGYFSFQHKLSPPKFLIWQHRFVLSLLEFFLNEQGESGWVGLCNSCVSCVLIVLHLPTLPDSYFDHYLMLDRSSCSACCFITLLHQYCESLKLSYLLLRKEEKDQ